LLLETFALGGGQFFVSLPAPKAGQTDKIALPGEFVQQLRNTGC
jgi:hypothetical protein